MNVKTKISVLTVISSCLFFLTSFVNFNSDVPPSTEVHCELIEESKQFNSKFKDLIEVECLVCELYSIQQEWNGDGLLEGTWYSYLPGSEPAIFNKIECEYSSNAAHYCQEQWVFEIGGDYCPNIFIPCTKEDDEECVND